MCISSDVPVLKTAWWGHVCIFKGVSGQDM